MRILFLSRWYPWPSDNGSKLRVAGLLRALSARHEVALLSFADDPGAGPQPGQPWPEGDCASARVVPYRPYRPASGRALLGLLGPWPRSLADTYSREMARAAAEELGRRRYDLVIASQLDMAPYALALRGVPVILEELEVATYLDAARSPGHGVRRARALLTWLKLVAYLRRSLPRFAACTVVSRRERDCVAAAVPGYSALAVVPNAVDLARYGGDFGRPERDTLVFAGALTYGANLDAARHFLSEIYPAIRREAPDLTLRITGRRDGVAPGALPERAGVVLTGHVPDVRPVVAQSWVSVVPLRRGGGTRLKIIESLALGTPVVATPKGAEGLDVTPGHDILIAADPGDFARSVVEVLRSPELRARLAAAGRRLVAARYDWATVGPDLSALAERVVAGASDRGAR